jgi:ribosomal protein L21
MYAVVESGGKQYRVQEGDIVSVEKLGLVEGESYTFDKVLLVATDDGIKTGNPCVEGATVTLRSLKKAAVPRSMFTSIRQRRLTVIKTVIVRLIPN